MAIPPLIFCVSGHIEKWERISKIQSRTLEIRFLNARLPSSLSELGIWRGIDVWGAEPNGIL
ncbi:MAG: hypothetical protein EBY32_01960 [Proteobacteria bacterium]|nr:hypothetical protein [Pseudomonadota bacterium]